MSTGCIENVLFIDMLLSIFIVDYALTVQMQSVRLETEHVRLYTFTLHADAFCLNQSASKAIKDPRRI